MKYLYQAGDTIHACESGSVHPNISLVWTYCDIDVPANESFFSEEKVTCAKCVLKMKLPKVGGGEL